MSNQARSDKKLPHDVWQAFIDLSVVRRLVCDGLGCNCPDAVFDDVVVGRPTVFPDPDSQSAVQLLVGRRLLVSLVPLERLVDVRAEAERLLIHGREIRDAHGLNRFRLVLVGRCDPAVLDELTAWVGRVDDRLHVHSVTTSALIRR